MAVKDRPDERYRVNLPSGIVLNPQLHMAGADLWPNDVVWLDNGALYPMYDDAHEMYGIVLGKEIKPKGFKHTLVATAP